MLPCLINLLLLIATFACALPQPGSRPLTEIEMDKLYPKCFVDVWTKKGLELHNVPGRCRIKQKGWEKIFAHTLSIAGGCGEQLPFFFLLLPIVTYIKL